MAKFKRKGKEIEDSECNIQDFYKNLVIEARTEIVAKRV